MQSPNRSTIKIKMNVVLRSKIFFILLIILPKVIWSVEIYEIQEVRLAKAELAIADGKADQAIQLLLQNLSNKEFHRDSFLALADLYLKRNQPAKALRLYHFIVKKLHGKTLLDINTKEDLLKQLQNIPPPNNEAMETYFQMGQTFYSIFDNPEYSVSLQSKMLKLAEKYLLITKHYKFALAESMYLLGIIQNKLSSYQESIQNFIDARELFEGMSTPEGPVSENTDKTLHLYLADSLIKEGFRDAGTMFLKSIVSQGNADEGMKSYAQNYLTVLSSHFFFATFTYGYYNNSNINSLDNLQVDNFEIDFASSLVKNEGIFLSKNASFFYSSERLAHHYNLQVNAEYNQDEARNRELGYRDSRSFSGRMTIKYDNLVKSIAKIGYGIQNTQIKDTGGGPFYRYSTKHIINPEYIHTLKRGTINYKGIWEYSDFYNLTTTTDTGLTLTYTPFLKNRLFAPSYGLTYRNEGEINAPDSTAWVLSTSNHFNVNSRLSLFFNVSYDINNNPSDTIDSFKKWDLSLYGTYLIPKIDALSLNSYLTKSYTSNNDGTSIDISLIGLNISLSI
jgi:hypothetical protein